VSTSTTTPQLAPTHPTPADHRAGPALRAAAVVAGGVLFAVGNALHPMEHDDAALEAPTWAAAHVTFAAGALLIAAGMAALSQRLAPSRLAQIGLGVLWVGLVLMPVSSILEAHVAPEMGHDAFHELEESIVWFSAVAGIPTLVGPTLVAFGALRHRLLPPLVALALLGTTIGLLASGAVAREGHAIVPGTIVFGLGIAAAGWVSRHPA
jgi:hypothetical protein